MHEAILHLKQSDPVLAGIIERVVYPQIPVRVEYRLTEKGLDLKPVIQAIHTWAEKWVELSDAEGSADLPAQELA